jgi:hypothetical protein
VGVTVPSHLPPPRKLPKLQDEVAKGAHAIMASVEISCSDRHRSADVQ